MSRLVLLGLSLTLGACGAAQQPPPDVISDRTSFTVTPKGLQVVFPQVDAVEARRQVFSCRFSDGGDNPRHAAMQCPVDLGAAQIEVAEGPAGVTVMIRLGARPALALRDWYKRNLQ